MHLFATLPAANPTNFGIGGLFIITFVVGIILGRQSILRRSK